MDKIKNPIKKGDIIFAGIILFLSVLFLCMQFLLPKGSKVLVTANGKKTEYALSKDKTIDIKDEKTKAYNRIQIKDGVVSMEEASCPDQICVHEKAISADGESIICLPNKIVVEVESDKERELDAVMK